MYLTDSLWLTILNAQGGKSGTAPVVVPTAIHFWPMNEGSGTTFVDHIGTNNAATTNVTWAVTPGMGAAAVASFSAASGSFGQLTYESAIDFNSSTSFSIAAWVRVSGATATGSVISSISGSFTHGVTLDGSGGGFRMFGPSAGAITPQYAADTTYFLVTTYAASGGFGTAQQYLNGVASGPSGGPTATTNTASATAFKIGGWTPSASFFNGPISFLRIWNVALTAPQVAALYTAGPV